MAQEEAGPDRKGSAPTSSHPTMTHPSSCPAPELGPASGRLKAGRKEEVLWEERKKKIEALAACSSSGQPLVPSRPD